MDKIQIQPLVELAIFIVAFLGTIIPLHIHLDSKMEKRSKETNDLIKAIQKEMNDFHTRLCLIEERRKK